MRWSSGEYQIAPIAARSTAMGRWRLTPPGVWGRRLRARDGAFRAPARVTFFFCKKKVTKENHSNLRFKDPWRGAGFAAPAASWLSPGGEAASGGHISFCEERNVGKKVA